MIMNRLVMPANWKVEPQPIIKEFLTKTSAWFTGVSAFRKYNFTPSSPEQFTQTHLEPTRTKCTNHAHNKRHERKHHPARTHAHLTPKHSVPILPPFPQVLSAAPPVGGRPPRRAPYGSCHRGTRAPVGWRSTGGARRSGATESANRSHWDIWNKCGLFSRIPPRK